MVEKSNRHKHVNVMKETGQKVSLTPSLAYKWETRVT
jgi:hypothetical protein